MSSQNNKGMLKWLALVVLIAIGVAVWFAPKNPPVFIEFRNGILSDGVLVVRNLSDATLTGTVAFFKPSASDGKAFPLLLKPGERREFGALQVKDYAPAAGSRGYVSIDGYIFTKQFSLLNKDTFTSSSVLWFLAK